jgi:inosine-uridine nucleoside N-ribohydrolase
MRIPALLITLAMVRPASGRIEDTEPPPSDGRRLIVAEANMATPEKPLLIIAGGPQTTVANALLTNPEIASHPVDFNLTVNGGSNGKDGWSA